jgi:cell division protein FtsB
MIVKNKQRNIRIIGLILIVVSLLLVTACANGGTNAADDIKTQTDTKPQKQVEREKLQLKLESISYNAEESEVQAEVTTNLPDGTEVAAFLIPPDDLSFGDLDRLTIQKGEKNKLSFLIDDYDKANFESGDYGIEFLVGVVGKDNDDEENSHMLSDPRVGGYSNDLASEYEDSEYVNIDQVLEEDAYDQDDYISDRYTIFIDSLNALPLQSGLSQSEKEQAQVKNEAEYEETYTIKMHDHTVSMQEQFVKFADLFGNPQFGDTNWMIDLSVVITEISRLSQEPKGFVVPEKYKETHTIYLEAMENYKIAMDILPSALDSMDLTRINEAKSYMDQALVKVKEVQEILS